MNAHFKIIDARGEVVPSALLNEDANGFNLECLPFFTFSPNGYNAPYWEMILEDYAKCHLSFISWEALKTHIAARSISMLFSDDDDGLFLNDQYNDFKEKIIPYINLFNLWKSKHYTFVPRNRNL